eukprot:NODE_330_length_10876_cov_0.359840.p8 type:complete len:127 gc:universal NODE_330_length_10876_cov_0.359840:5664-5284(-)
MASSTSLQAFATCCISDSFFTLRYFDTKSCISITDFVANHDLTFSTIKSSVGSAKIPISLGKLSRNSEMLLQSFSLIVQLPNSSRSLHFLLDANILTSECEMKITVSGNSYCSNLTCNAEVFWYAA